MYFENCWFVAKTRSWYGYSANKKGRTEPYLELVCLYVIPEVFQSIFLRKCSINSNKLCQCIRNNHRGLINEWSRLRSLGGSLHSFRVANLIFCDAMIKYLRKFPWIKLSQMQTQISICLTKTNRSLYLGQVGLCAQPTICSS